MIHLYETFKTSLKTGLLILLFSSKTALAMTSVLNMTDTKRLEANIAAELMNRLTVTNDRIVNIFGDDGTFVTQSDEQTGQVFIKTTPENGAKPLSLTLITENGLTQDLLLNPIEKTATTLILKSSPMNKNMNSVTESLLPGFNTRNQTLQSQWITIMKQAVLEELPEFTGKILSETRNHPNLQLKMEKCYQSGVLFVRIWALKNTGREVQELQEKNFYQEGDLAISLQKRKIQPNEKVYMYILGNI